MAEWEHVLEIKDLWKKATDREITPQQFGQGMTEIISAQPYYEEDGELQTVSDMFFELGEDPEASWDDVDEAMEKLYDWGDTILEPFGAFPTHRLCFIATF
jgi:hypothetical protein